MLHSETTICKEKNGIFYLQFKRLMEYTELIHMYVLKNKDMNFKREDQSKESIKKLEQEYETVCHLEQMNVKDIIRPTQNHTDVVKCVYKKYSNSAELYLPEYQNVDGLLTNQKNFVLSTTNADCNLILLYDIKNKVIGNVHSGWKGTFKKIVQKAVEKMQEEYQSKPENIIACMAPSIHKCCFEVNKDVEEPCREIFKKTGRITDIIVKGKEDKYYIDTVLINKLLLEEVGLKPENIIDSGICSKCSSKYVHSRRAEGKNYGVGTLLVSLK